MSETSVATIDLQPKPVSEYIGGAAGGVPELIFQPGFQACVRGFSNVIRPGIHNKNYNLDCNVSETSVEICDADRKYIAFTARLEHSPVNSTREVLTLNINNADWHDNPVERYPDIYPAALLERTLRYFAQQGHDIKFIKGHWVGEFARSDNHQAYKEALRQSDNPNDPQTKNTIAQKETWTGQQLARLGYKVTSVDDRDPNDIYVMFEKVEEPPLS